MKAPQFTLTLAKALQNSEIPVTYEVLSFKGESAGLMPVLGESKIGQPTGFEHFPIFDEDYRKILVGKIVDRYYGYEIGTESVDMFWNAVRRWLNANMPFYNELYRKIPFDDAFLTVDITSESEVIGENSSTSKGTADTTSSSEGKSNSSTTGENSGKAFQNEMPQTGMTEGEYYATSATENAGKSATSGNSTETGKTTSGTKDTGETTGNSLDKSTSATKGFQGNRNAMLADFRANIINTDDLIVKAMRPLFMLVWKNTETATTTEYMRGLL